MDILFWSGGKDSYLAYRFYQRSQEGDENPPLKLLTTYSRTTGRVPHQNIPLERIRRQAEWLELDLVSVPMEENPSNETYLSTLKETLQSERDSISHLVFGDWHLEDIRRWREEQFAEMGYACLFPIWRKDLHDLLPVLQLTPVKVTISSVHEDYTDQIGVGERYTPHFIRTLPEGIDPMGERGEFHTEVSFEAFEE